MKTRFLIIIGIIVFAFLVGSNQQVDAKCGPPDLPCSAPPNTYEFGAISNHPLVELNIPILILTIVTVGMIALILALILMIKRKH
jgi:hypothetical protein